MPRGNGVLKDGSALATSTPPGGNSCSGNVIPNDVVTAAAKAIVDDDVVVNHCRRLIVVAVVVVAEDEIRVISVPTSVLVWILFPEVVSGVGESGDIWSDTVALILIERHNNTICKFRIQTLLNAREIKVKET